MPIMAEAERRIGILGGTFDPIHFGHLRPAVEVRSALGLHRIRLVPCRVSPHRDPPLATAGERLAMLRDAVGGADDLIVDPRELAREGPSYTIDTLDEIIAEEPVAKFHLIMGADAFAAFDRWHRWQDILERAHLVVMHRPGTELRVPDAVADCVVERPEDLEQQSAGRILLQAVTQLDISATAIRALAAAGGDLRYLVPEPVRTRILTHRIYQRNEASRNAGGTTG